VSGTYSYGAGSAGPHAVTSIGSMTFGYDLNGNMTNRNGATIAWTRYNLPSRIDGAGGAYSEFLYGGDRSRYVQKEDDGTSLHTRHYAAPGLFEAVYAGSSHLVDYQYVHANGHAVAQITTASSGDDTQYLHRDHQGSVVATTDTSGTVLDRFEYDPFGVRTVTVGSEDGNARGYTGHEHLAALDVIHMNGRVQDPLLGRFLSPDPFVQAPYQSQSLNRYSYVWNNPLSRVDPSGFENECVMGKWENCTSEQLRQLKCRQDATWCHPGETYFVEQNGDENVFRAHRQGDSMQALRDMQMRDWIDAARQAVSGAAEQLERQGPEAFDDVTGLVTAGREIQAAVKSGDVEAGTKTVILLGAENIGPRRLKIFEKVGERLSKVFSGGAYGKLKSIAGWERHHMPADSVSPLSRNRGPAIQMEQAEHALTSSYGNSAAAQVYRQEIGQLIKEGRWRDAMAQEIRDVRAVAGSKYNEAIQQMLDYGRSIGIID
jgi:RHS repeat-associated protein